MIWEFLFKLDIDKFRSSEDVTFELDNQGVESMTHS